MTEEMAVCPVMKSPVNKAEAEAQGLVRTIDGKKYYLCCDSCEVPFDTDPQQHIKSEEGTSHEGHHHH